MKLRTPRRIGQTDSVIPLVNVVFLLLVFFMLFGTVNDPELFPIAVPESDTDEKAPRRGVTVLLGADGSIAIGDTLASAPALEAHVQALVAEGAQVKVLLKADGALGADTLLTVLEGVQRGGAAEIVLLTAGRGR